MLDMLLGQLTLDVGRFRDVLKVEAPPPVGETAASRPTPAGGRGRAPRRRAAGRTRR
jgi:hypothetical protein